MKSGNSSDSLNDLLPKEPSGYILNHMTRVLFVHNARLQEEGGAELSLRHHFEHHPSHVQVSSCFPDEPVNLEEWDILLLGNIRPRGGPGEQAEAESARQWTEKVLTFSGRAIKSERDIHPCCHRDARCIRFPELTKTEQHCSNLIPSTFKALYDACDAIQVLSPLHDRVIGCLTRSVTPRRAIGSPIALDQFVSRTPRQSRKNEALIFEDTLRKDDDAESAAIRAGYRPCLMRYGSVPYDQMPDLLNQFRAVVIHPRMFHAFGRLAVEAMACGCRVISNHKVGALSWPDPIEASREANKLFWKFLLENDRQLHDSKIFQTA
jgi:hypothetical protein